MAASVVALDSQNDAGKSNWFRDGEPEKEKGCREEPLRPRTVRAGARGCAHPG